MLHYSRKDIFQFNPIGEFTQDYVQYLNPSEFQEYSVFLILSFIFLVDVNVQTQIDIQIQNYIHVCLNKTSMLQALVSLKFCNYELNHKPICICAASVLTGLFCILPLLSDLMCLCRFGLIWQQYVSLSSEDQ